MQFRILGSLEVLVDGRRADLGGRQQQRVLAALLLGRNRVVSTDQLIDALWGEAPSNVAVKTLRSYVYHLRRALEPGRPNDAPPSVLITRSPGYFLQVDADQLDSDRFEQLAKLGHAAIARGDPADAVKYLYAALDLWRGPALGDLADEEFARASISRLEEGRLAATEALFESRLALGEHRQLIGELHEFSQQNPDRETARGHLMVALYRSGRRAEALQQYREAWRYFHDEHGVEPERLRELEAAILRDDPELTWAPPVPSGTLVLPADPTKATQHHAGDGGARSLDDEPAGSAGARRATVALQQLPPDTLVLAGRDAVLDELQQVLQPTAGDGATMPVVLLSGQAGVGKTALAVHAAHLVSHAFPDGQLYVHLDGAGPRHLDPMKMLEQLLRALGIPGPGIPDTLEERVWLYRDRLAGRRTLVLLDNAASEAQVRPLLPGSASCAVIITSRSGLGGLDATTFVDLQVLSPDHGSGLLERLIGPARVQAEPEAAQRIVQLCGGLPLALCIVGAKLRRRSGMGLHGLADRLSHEQGRLSQLAAGDRAVRASFASSYEGLADDDRRAFRLLGLVRAPDFGAWVIAPLLDEATGVAEERAERLADAHLLEFAREDETERVRYRFPDLLRLFAQELLGQQEPRQGPRAAAGRLLGAYLELTRRADARLDFGGLGGVDDRATWPLDDPDLVKVVEHDPLGWFAAEHTALVRAVEQAADLGFDTLTWSLANTIAASCEARGQLDDWLRTHELALPRTRSAGNRRWEAYVLCGLGVVHREKGSLKDAVDCFEQCLPIASELGDGRLAFFCMLSLGVVHRLQSKWEPATTCLEQCLSMVQGRNEPYWHAYTLREIGILQRYKGRWEAAMDYLQQAGKLLADVHSRRWLAATLREIGIVHRAQGRLDEALDHLERSLQIFQEVGDRRREAAALRSIGVLRLEQGQLEAALDHLNSSLQIFQERHDQHGAACTLVHLGDATGAQGRHRDAIEQIAQGLKVFGERGDLRWEGKALISLGEQLAAAGEAAAAEAAWRDAIGRLGPLGVPEAARAEALLDQGALPPW